ncbi:MAG: hypothetical protein RIC55_12635 [Pirellulaceae bacterium]
MTTTTLTPTNKTRKSRPGAPTGNRNATRHGLRGSGLPPGCSYLASQLTTFRRYLRGLVAERQGNVSIYAEAVIQSACRHEKRALLSARWLRIEGDRLNIDQRSKLLRDEATATDARDKCLAALGLDRQIDPWDAALSQGRIPTIEADSMSTPPQDAADAVRGDVASDTGQET